MRCTYISGPCVDETQAGRRCPATATSTDSVGQPVCDRHDFNKTERVPDGPVR